MRSLYLKAITHLWFQQSLLQDRKGVNNTTNVQHCLHERVLLPLGVSAGDGEACAIGACYENGLQGLFDHGGEMEPT